MAAMKTPPIHGMLRQVRRAGLAAGAAGPAMSGRPPRHPQTGLPRQPPCAGELHVGSTRRTAVASASRVAGLGSTQSTPNARATGPQHSMPEKKLVDKARIGVDGCWL